MLSKRQRNFALLCFTGSLGILSLFAIPAQGQQAKLAMNVTAEVVGQTSPLASFRADPAGDKLLDLHEGKPYVVSLPKPDWASACLVQTPTGREIGINFKDGAAYKSVAISEGHPWYPKAGEEKVAIFKCYKASGAAVVDSASQTVKLSRK
ncbi:hypothetical protein KW796_00295 [Candidatus Parcubacteria bacterium]|nr:hypothetical protein [Candidatus Parcubacteria bacterium]